MYDGDSSRLINKRTGGLKMGGTYWYYYRLDYDGECYDDSMPSTTNCPLLPGQRVNVMEVPVDARPVPPGHVRTPSSPRLTMDPKAKFVNPRPVPALTTATKPSNSVATANTPVVSAAAIKSTNPQTANGILPLTSNGPTHFAAAKHSPSPISLLAGSRKRSKSVSSMPSTAIKSAFHHLTTRRRASDSDERSQGVTDAAEDMDISSPILTSSSLDINSTVALPPRSRESTPPRTPGSTGEGPHTARTPPFSPLRCHPPTAHDEMKFAEGTLESLKSHAISSIAESTLDATLAQLRTYSRSTASSSTESVVRRPTSNHGYSRDPSPLRRFLFNQEARSSSGSLDVPEDIAESEDEYDSMIDTPVAPIGNPMPLTMSSVAAIPEVPVVTARPCSPTPDMNKNLPDLPKHIAMPTGAFAPPADWNITPMGELGSKFSAWSSDTARSSLTLEPCSPPDYPGSPTFSSTDRKSVV